MLNLKQYLPPFYDNLQETDQLMLTEDESLTEAQTAFLRVIDNQFIATCDAEGLQQYEFMLNITAYPSTESLDFRKQRVLNRLTTRPPFTLPFLRSKLDEIIGSGNYNVYVDYENYTLYVESRVSNQQWYNEVAITINSIKPANIVFINKPYISENVQVGEQITRTEALFTRLGFWGLGTQPFLSYSEEEVIKVPQTRSITDQLLSTLAENVKQQIKAVKINDAHMISDFLTLEAQENQVLLEYTVPVLEGVSNITNVKILNDQDTILSSADMYVPLNSETVMKHTILIEEVKA